MSRTRTQRGSVTKAKEGKGVHQRDLEGSALPRSKTTGIEEEELCTVRRNRKGAGVRRTVAYLNRLELLIENLIKGRKRKYRISEARPYSP